jgi:eukaryotic-like serine/threonine-protein kinase
MPYGSRAYAYMSLGRFDDAKEVMAQAESRGMDPSYFHEILYTIAFVQNDDAGMRKQVDWARSQAPESEIQMLQLEIAAAGAYGDMRRARQLTLRAVDLALSRNLSETAASCTADEAVLEATIGNYSQASEQAKRALRPSHGMVEYSAAYALARAGELAQAKSLADDLIKRSPLGTFQNKVHIPVILAVVEIRNVNPAHAVELLEAGSAYELGEESSLAPAYVRGEAYLQMHEGKSASEEFQKILDHRGVDPFGFVLAKLGSARAYRLLGDATKAKAAYDEFFALWKNADSDIPVLKQAKAEYAKLQ